MSDEVDRGLDYLEAFGWKLLLNVRGFTAFSPDMLGHLRVCT
jgi:hypothetical protein